MNSLKDIFFSPKFVSLQNKLDSHNFIIIEKPLYGNYGYVTWNCKNCKWLMQTCQGIVPKIFKPKVTTILSTYEIYSCDEILIKNVIL